MLRELWCYASFLNRPKDENAPVVLSIDKPARLKASVIFGLVERQNWFMKKKKLLNSTLFILTIKILYIRNKWRSSLLYKRRDCRLCY